MMAKGEYERPGPFSLAGDDEFPEIHRAGVPQYLGSLDQAEREELVGLLNKGTHFEGMLEALKAAQEYLVLHHHETDAMWDGVAASVRAAIAKAEGENDASQD